MNTLRDHFKDDIERMERQRERGLAYKGPALPFTHLGHDREAAMPWLSHVEAAGTVRMLMRGQLDHENICCMARDRILHLAQKDERLHTALPASVYHEDFGNVLWWAFPIVEPPYVGSPNDSDWPGYHTHFSPIPIPAAPLSTEQGQTMKLSNGQYTRLKIALESTDRVGPDFQWRQLSEALDRRDQVTLIRWARDQIKENPQPHAATTAS